MAHTPLLERDRELAGLSALIASAREGAGQLVVVQGPAGIGKTRLLTAARTEAEWAGLRVLAARGSDLEREFAYGLVRQLFEPVLASGGEAERTKLLSGAAGQAAALLGYAEPIPAPQRGDDASFASLHGLFWLTANLCAQGPLLMIVDDLHWGDASSLRFLAHLLPRLDGLPLLAAVALRSAEPGFNQHLLAQIITDPLATLLRPAPLSQSGSAQLVRGLLRDDPDEAFCAACHAATGGNPLLLCELTSVAVVEGVAPSAAGVARLAKLGYQAIGQRVALRLERLGTRAKALCGAVAILGEDAEPTVAAAIAGLKLAEAFETARELAAIEILRPHAPFGFVHPLVRDAVYEGLPVAARIDGHVQAARLLAKAGAACEQVAAHLLLIPPAGDEWVVTILRHAAEEAFRRGSPEAAVTYLERCLHEPPPLEKQAEILFQAGAIAQLVDMAKAAEHLRAALTLIQNPARRALIAEMLGSTLNLVGRHDEAVEVYLQAAETLGDKHADLRQGLEVGLLTVALSAPALRELATKQLVERSNGSSDKGPSSRMLDCLTAIHEAFAGVPAEAVITRVQRGLADGILLQQVNSSASFLSGCVVLMAADLDEAMPLLDTALAKAHQCGSIFAFGVLKCFRALAWFWRGALAEAEADARDAVRAIMTSRVDIARPLAASFLMDALMEQGRLEEAAVALEWAGMPKPTPPTGHWYQVLDSHAHLLLRQGRTKEGLDAMLACGRCYDVYGRKNPAIVAWRSGAAQALLALDRREEARVLAAEELTLARRWGAPRALGHALWIAGLIEGGENGLSLLHEAVTVLEPSPARLEHAKALVELGAALRRLGQRTASRQYLRRGLELAEICGAVPLFQRAQTELRATGARPRRTAHLGAAALTPSERRVAELAVAGCSNRDIAQALYITAKTVEAHLTRAYRKLGVTGRTGLAQALAAPNQM
jgi:DNA-binding CsgD family transcriptional regulator